MKEPLASCALALVALSCLGANYRTPNFVVQAETTELARQVGESAELWRRRLAAEWLGKELPAWSRPCQITVQAAPERAPNGRTRILAQGESAFVEEIVVVGSLARILDSVLPHEMTHAVFASYFPQPLPRWADEGASTSVEHHSQQAEQQRRVSEILLSGQALSVRELFLACEESQHLTALYVQGYSLTQFLLAHGGKQKFVAFLDEGMASDSWADALQNQYGFVSLAELQGQWLQWALPGL